MTPQLGEVWLASIKTGLQKPVKLDWVSHDGTVYEGWTVESRRARTHPKRVTLASYRLLERVS